jgi:hypothetical protein
VQKRFEAVTITENSMSSETPLKADAVYQQGKGSQTMGQGLRPNNNT